MGVALAALQQVSDEKACVCVAECVSVCELDLLL